MFSPVHRWVQMQETDWMDGTSTADAVRGWPVIASAAAMDRTVRQYRFIYFIPFSSSPDLTGKVVLLGFSSLFSLYGCGTVCKRENHSILDFCAPPAKKLRTSPCAVYAKIHHSTSVSFSNSSAVSSRHSPGPSAGSNHTLPMPIRRNASTSRPVFPNIRLI